MMKIFKVPSKKITQVGGSSECKRRMYGNRIKLDESRCRLDVDLR